MSLVRGDYLPIIRSHGLIKNKIYIHGLANQLHTERASNCLALRYLTCRTIPHRHSINNFASLITKVLWGEAVHHCLISAWISSAPPLFSAIYDLSQYLTHPLIYFSFKFLTWLVLGAVQIKNWKALDLEQIADDELTSVEDMLGDLSNVATLRIKIIR